MIKGLTSSGELEKLKYEEGYDLPDEGYIKTHDSESRGQEETQQRDH